MIRWSVRPHNLTELLQEAQKMDQLIEAYERSNTQKQFHKGKRKQGCLQLQEIPLSFADF